MSSAVMYPLKHLLNLDDEELVSTLDEKWGEKLQDLVLQGGNFGKAVWYEINYWKTFLAYTPRRIKQRKLSFRHK